MSNQGGLQAVGCKVLLAREVAALLRISERHLRNQTKAGKILCIRLGESVRYSREYIEDLLSRKERINASQGQ